MFGVNKTNKMEELVKVLDNAISDLEKLRVTWVDEYLKKRVKHEECKHPRSSRRYVGQGLLYCELCGETFG